MDTNYIRKIAEAVSAYNRQTNIRWYYDCESALTAHFTGGITNSAMEGGKQININDNFGHLQVKAMHEMGHVMGFCHEHQRPDRPDDVVILDDMDTNQPINFAKISYADWYNKLAAVGYLYDKGSYDASHPKSRCHIFVLMYTDSVMHYGDGLGGHVKCKSQICIMYPCWDIYDNCGPPMGLSTSDIAQISDIYSSKVAARKANAYQNGMPRGEYALPMTRHGCPDGFRDSMFYFDDENSGNSNYKSADFFDYMAGYQHDDTLLYFCDSGNSCLSLLTNGCHLITDRQTCLSGRDGRAGDHFGSPCVWCGDGPDDRCTTHNLNKCEPLSFLESVPDVLVTPQKHEYAIDPCSRASSKWPAGQYCILRGAETKSCPAGFTHSSRYMDDEDDENRNKDYGGVNVIENSGANGGSTYHFCCRNDGHVDREAVLVSNAGDGPESFALYPKTATCQKFKHYSSKMLNIFHDNEDSGNNNQETGNLPYGKYDGNTRLYICVYLAHVTIFEDPPIGDVDHHIVIHLDNPANDHPANDRPIYEFRLHFNYTASSIIYVVRVTAVTIAIVLFGAFICCRYGLNKCMKREKHGKYAKVSLESDAWSASDADKELILAADDLIAKH